MAVDYFEFLRFSNTGNGVPRCGPLFCVRNYHTYTAATKLSNASLQRTCSHDCYGKNRIDASA